MAYLLKLLGTPTKHDNAAKRVINIDVIKSSISSRKKSFLAEERLLAVSCYSVFSLVFICLRYTNYPAYFKSTSATTKITIITVNVSEVKPYIFET